jgi:anti-sigma-K factor RskA
MPARHRLGDWAAHMLSIELQFWTKLEGAVGPTSLGLVQAGQVLQLPLSRLPGVGPQQLFEITLEPEGGSKIARPTGPILYVGRSVAL